METSQNYISEKIRNSSNTVINPATEEKQDDIITALWNISIDADSVNLNTDWLEALGTAGNASLSSIDTKQSTIIWHVDWIEGQITTTNNLIDALYELVARLEFLPSIKWVLADIRVTPTGTVTVGGTLTTVSTVTTVSSLTNLTNIGGIPATVQIPSLMNMVANNNIINIANV